ncbi:hypothetical protein COV24_00135 [candidate division WWE3 bacterium CG10_big_fil_rev_8_21_14_0_10_32_10]|uniref:DUF2207 domain-containing protein n=1 Tax=candidate division WWE3 bacterium CG10_big_fil_rev_8_21_14_0_10_32_10 TaxID=1975090 RepID=A0A2H0RBK5_UNCKA|nr:MAG: hypothetical protein COV24_00135 [candidate division WWE3 bacterium CG10_big_fil_rev_8_21_14_0_10_32_10]
MKKILFTLILFLIYPCNIRAQTDYVEQINSYDNLIKINTDGSLTVTETIDVNANGNLIKRGIYRDFPTQYKTKEGLNKNTTFEVFEVLKNGQREPYHIQNMSNGKRLYIGDNNVYLNPGRYTYTIMYKTNYQISFLQNTDELYYNAIGTGWDFNINKGGAIVELPKGITQNQISYTAYTGTQGSTEKNYTANVKSVENNTNVEFLLTKPLLVGEGLTVVVGFPKGYVQGPTQIQEITRFVLQNIITILGVILIFIIFSYYIIIWLKYGRDKNTYPSIEDFDLPKKISPAALRYVYKMSFDNKAVTAAILNAAIKGYIKIEEKDKKFTIKLVNKDVELFEEEKLLLNNFIQENEDQFTFSNTKHVKIRTAILDFAKSIKKTYLNTYFVNNLKYLAFPTILIIAYIGLSLFMNSFRQSDDAIFLLVVFFLVLITIPFIFALRARTEKGSELFGKIKGLKKYLTATEERRYESNLHKEIPFSLKVYETYMPYAVALDVEPIWSKRLKQSVDKAEISENELRNTSWYTGTRAFTSASFASGLSSSINSSIASSSIAPGSSSGFSGGSSGGGGGGGGGGGW